jgi:NAD(P)-dependent dehydrogenase (short-subunit alcohol dehydrogenase family)
MNGKVILITGSTDGIGKQTALQLARLGATVLLHGRNHERGLSALYEIRSQTGNKNNDFFIADLSSLNQVRRLAEEVQQKYERLDVLINNAGVFMNERILTEDGLETTFAVNHLSHFLLTLLLLDTLKKSAPSRIINVSSIAQRNATVDFDNLLGEKRFGGYEAYALSKLANVLFTNELAKRLEGTGVTVNSLHPGVITTKLLSTGFNIAGASLEEGAATSVYLARSPDVAGVSGKYFISKRESAPSKFAENPEFRRAFWEASEKLVGIEVSI